jgi:hypothetical protein
MSKNFHWLAKTAVGAKRLSCSSIRSSIYSRVFRLPPAYIRRRTCSLAGSITGISPIDTFVPRSKFLNLTYMCSVVRKTGGVSAQDWGTNHLSFCTFIYCICTAAGPTSRWYRCASCFVAIDVSRHAIVHVVFGHTYGRTDG